jgi:protein gp37
VSDGSSIEWTDATWSPVAGCTKISDGCLNCYIERTPPFRMAHRRFQHPDPVNGASDMVGASTGVQLHPERLSQPFRWRKPRRIFVCSLADLFHSDVSDEFIARVFSVMALAPHLTFQVLTKRAPRMRALLSDPTFLIRVLDLTYLTAMGEDPDVAGPAQRRAAQAYVSYPPNPGTPLARLVPWPLPNVWVGVSAESQDWADRRIPELLLTPAAVRWVSAEPMLGPIDFAAWMPPGHASWQCSGCLHYFSGPHREVCPSCNRTGYWSGSHAGNGRPNGQPLSWIVTGGESGPGARPMNPGWARTVRDQCVDAGVPFLFKQWGGRTPKANGRLLDGMTWDEYPTGAVS